MCYLVRKLDDLLSRRGLCLRDGKTRVGTRVSSCVKRAPLLNRPNVAPAKPASQSPSTAVNCTSVNCQNTHPLPFLPTLGQFHAIFETKIASNNKFEKGKFQSTFLSAVEAGGFGACLF